MTIPILAWQYARCGHVEVKIPFAQGATGPKPLDEPVFADEFAVRRDKRAKDIQRSSTQPYGRLLGDNSRRREPRQKPPRGKLPIFI